MPALKKLLLLSFFATIYLSALPLASPVFAQEACFGSTMGIKLSFNPPMPIPANIPELKVTLTGNGIVDGKYRLRFAKSFPPGAHTYFPESGETASGGKVTFALTGPNGKVLDGEYRATLEKLDANNNWQDRCKDLTFRVGYQGAQCLLTAPSLITESDRFDINVINAPAGNYDVILESPFGKLGQITINSQGTGSTKVGPLSPQQRAEIYLKKSGNTGLCTKGINCICHTKFTINAGASSTLPTGRPGVGAPVGTSHGSVTSACPRGRTGAAGCTCNVTIGPTTYQGIATAIGCIPTQPVGLIKSLIQLMMAIGGGVAFLIMLMGVFQMITSAGNADSLKAGSERLTSAIIGILFLVFSILILQIIGFGILNIPGFGGP